MPPGIGEYPITPEAVIEELNKMAAPEDLIEMIPKYFSSGSNTTKWLRHYPIGDSQHMDITILMVRFRMAR